MTEELAIKILTGDVIGTTEQTNEAVTMAVRALSQPDVPETKVGDTIYRQAAIDALDVLCQEHRYKIPGKRETYSEYNEAWQDALERAERAIGSLPSAQQWIPFSERLPEANRVVLLAFSHNAVVGYWIDILPDGKPIWYAATGNGWATDIDCENYGYPTAWMPVPDVLGGEEDEP